MFSASSFAFILIFLVLLPGLTAAVLGAILYAALSLIPARGWVKAGLVLGCASGGAVIFAAMGHGTTGGLASILAGVFLTLAWPLCILSPIVILAEKAEYAPCAGILTVVAALFCAAATGGLIQVLSITAFLGAGTSLFPPNILYLISFAIWAGIHIVLGAEFFLFVCLIKQRREKNQGKRAAE